MLLSHTLVSSADLTLHNRLNRPALIARHRLGLYDLDLVTDLTTDLVMRLHTIARKHHLLIKRVTKFTSDLNYHGFGHFITGDHTGHSTTIIHYAPSRAACWASRRIVSMRAMS